RPSLNPSFIRVALEDSLHVNAGRMHAVWLKFTDFDQIFDFGNRDLRGRSHHGIEISRRLPIDKISPFIALPGFYKGKIRLQCALHHIHASFEFTRFFVFSDQCAETRWRVESRNSRTTGANTF